jgi:kynureninase
VPFPIGQLSLTDAWIVGGGYKYLQLGEGNCFLRLPAHAERLRPVVTGWFAAFDTLAEPGGESRVAYGPGAQRFAGATYDPTSHYRAARVFRFFEEQGLTPTLLRGSYRRQLDVLATAFDAVGAPDAVITRDGATPLSSLGGFLSLGTSHAQQLQESLKKRGVSTDTRGRYLRFGPAPYLADSQLEAAIDALGESLHELGR